MGFLSGKNNNFKFNFPKVFMPQEIEDKYSPILNRIPGNMCTTVLDFINYSIMSVELEINPETYEPIEQTDRGTPTFGRLTRPSTYPDYLFAKDMTITFQLDSAYIIWAILIDLFIYYYTEHKEKFIPTPNMEILDCYNFTLYRLSFERLLFTGVSGLQFDFSSNEVEQKTITTTWKAGAINVLFDPSKV